MVVCTETGLPGEEIRVHGRVMGKLEIKHERFYDPETQTEYIRWNAPQSLRLMIADKDPKSVVHVKVRQEEREEPLHGEIKKDEKTGKPVLKADGTPKKIKKHLFI
jgi:hypothetical protein